MRLDLYVPYTEPSWACFWNSESTEVSLFGSVRHENVHQCRSRQRITASRRVDLDPDGNSPRASQLRRHSERNQDLDRLFTG